MEHVLAKQQLRDQMRLWLRNVTPERRRAAGESAWQMLEQQACWGQARNILFFAPLRDEPDTWPWLERCLDRGSRCSLPRFDPVSQAYRAYQVQNTGRDLRAGRYGIPEPTEECVPVALKSLDFVLVPGVAFDLHGRRLGRGRGYYDRLLAEVCGTACAVAFDEQIVAEVPVEPHDVRLNCILTPTRWIVL